MIRVCPCKDCDKRNADCHSICRAYKEWSKENEKMRDERNERVRIAYLSRDTRPKRRRR